jgi:hypothetical protein
MLYYNREASVHSSAGSGERSTMMPSPKTCSIWALLAAALLTTPWCPATLLPTAQAADAAASGEGGTPTALAIWNPSESWPGGSQADSRLDQPVRFWRAGLTLEEVFSAVHDQAGVTIGFFPANDVNCRIRVNLFLDPYDPPSLRDLMAQLSWVTECSFAFADTRQGRAYSLLSTSRGRDLQEEVGGGGDALTKDNLDWIERHREESFARIQVYSQALRLSRDELIARYRGADDYLLYNLLDPGRRAALQLWCELPEEDQLALLREEREIVTDWTDLKPPERARMMQIFDLDDAALGLDHIRVIISSDGIMSHFTLQQNRGDQDHEDWQWTAGLAWGWPAECELSPKDEIALRRLLGERISAEREQTYIQQRAAETEAERRATQQAREERRGAQHRSLSPEMEELLASTTLTSCGRGPYALWEIQQMVAAAAQLSIVSDSFCDLPRPQREADRPSALRVLSAACVSPLPRARQEMLGNWGHDTARFCLAWEWGDAGHILRFRSIHRDLWRAALLPPDALALLDRWIAPHLEPDSLTTAEGAHIQVPVDLDGILWLASHLDTTQARFGGLLIYGDPADEKESWTCGFRQWATAVVSWNLIWKLLSTFSPEQWDMLRDGGVRFDRDLSPSQLELARDAFPRLGQNARLEGDVTDYTMRIAEGDLDPPYTASPPREYHFEFLADGSVMAGHAPPTTILACPVWPPRDHTTVPSDPASSTD